LLRRLKAIDLFLDGMPPHERDRIKFIFISIPSREGVDEYRALREDVEARIGRLNGKYATLNNSPIHFMHGSVDFTELCALYGASEVGLVTPLVDGMNLVAKEYVASRLDTGGALVLSEFAGAATELRQAFLCNPHDPDGVKDALLRAVEVTPAEARRRVRIMQRHLRTHDVGHWARSFLNELGVPEAA
jgi:trehalose 6-phosphate synthase